MSAGPSESVSHDALLPLLMVLTVTTGMIDAISFVGLGHVFTANMTGNVVFIGFALGGADGVSVARSLVALVSFGGGALIGGRVVNRAARPPLHQLAMATGGEAILLSIAVAMAFGATTSPRPATVYALIVLTAVAMGLRNAVVRKLGVADVTTTVLTMTITGIAADSSLAGGDHRRHGRRALSLLAMVAGAWIGTLLLRQWGYACPLAAAALVAAAVTAHAATRWTTTATAPDIHRNAPGEVPGA
jgi:uncharacterized membrane protein YoaK (UPF0700 family)